MSEELKKSSMRKFFYSWVINLGIVSELFSFLMSHKLWWMVPVIFIIFILMIFLFAGHATGLAPFIYPLF